MLRRLTVAFAAWVLLAGLIVGQDASPKTPSPPPASSAASPNKVEGLELPGDQTVAQDEGFVNVTAKTKGDVRWMVVSNVKVKYVTVESTKSVIISIPPQGGVVVTVFAIAAVDGKLTEFARTNITVGGPQAGPDPGQTPKGSMHVTFLIDMNNSTPQLATLLNSQTLRQGITGRGHFFRLYDLKSPVVTQKKLDAVARRVGGNAVMIIQKNDGVVVEALKIPATEAEILAAVNKAGGNS
jgi:hypothetical protein